MQPRLFALLAGLVAVAVAPVAIFAQGSLIPPGAPGPVMKTLDQVEPRIPLVAGAPGVAVNEHGGITISAPGSYYLTRELSVSAGNGITINTAAVVVDLSGYAVYSNGFQREGWGITTAGDLNLSTYADLQGAVTVRNGFVTSHGIGGFQNGLRISGVVEDVVVRNGMGEGIRALVVRRCAVYQSLFTGIAGVTVEDSRVVQFGLIGISAEARASRCMVVDTGVVGAATAINGKLVESCVVTIATVAELPNRQIRGILATVVKDSTVNGPASTGIEASLAMGCWTTGVTANVIANKNHMP